MGFPERNNVSNVPRFRVLIAGFIGIAAFAWGLATGTWHLFPYEPVRAIFRAVKQSLPVTKLLADASSTPTLTQSELQSARLQLRQWLVPTTDVKSEVMKSSKDFVASLSVVAGRAAESIIESVKEVRVISGQFDAISGWRWRSLYLRNGGRKLLIVHWGHGDNPFQSDIVKLALDAGYDVIAMTMPMVNWNRIPSVEVKTWDGPGLLLDPVDHGALEMLDTGDKHFIGFFISPVVASIDKAFASQDYDSVSMVGFSGGGWTTVISAAVDDRIRKSVAVAGLLPFFARQQAKDLTDAEQYDAAFYKKFPSPLIYQMAADDRRLLAMVYNDADPCCFDAASAQLFAKYLAKERNYYVKIVESATHSFPAKTVMDLLEGGEFKFSGNE